MANIPVPATPENTPIGTAPCLGLYLDRPSQLMDPRALDACNNVRINEGRIHADKMGWTAYLTSGGNPLALNGPVTCIDTFQMSDGHQWLILGTPTDLYQANTATAPVFITPVYNTGTVTRKQYSVSQKPADTTIGAAGSGYKLGDTGTLTGGTGIVTATYTVVGVSGTTVTAVNITNPGAYSALPGNAVATAVTTGGGNGALTLNITAGNPALVGVGTFWNTPIGGSETTTLSADVAVGSTSLPVNSIPLNIQAGQLLVDTNVAAALTVGTLLTGYTTDTLLISKVTAFAMNKGDTIQIGGQLANLRRNIRAEDQIYFGSAAQNDPTATYYTVQVVINDTLLILKTDPGTQNAVVYTCRQCFAGWQAASSPFGVYRNRFSTETYPAAGAPYNSDLWFAVNGQDPTFIWDGAKTFGQFATTVPFIAGCIHRHRNTMMYGNLIGSNGQNLPSSMASSDNGLPHVMAGGIAFQGVVSDGPFTIVRIATLGAVALMYLRGPVGGGADSGSTQGGAVISASYLGTVNVWSFAEVIRGRGPVSAGAVMEFPDRHEFIGHDGQYRYNGLFIQVMNDHIWRKLLRTFDWNRADMLFGTLNPTYGDLHWAFPAAGDGVVNALTAYTEEYMEQANSYLFKPYTQRDFPFISAGLWTNTLGWKWSADSVLTFTQSEYPLDDVTTQSGAPTHLVGDINGYVWQLYTSDTQNGSGFGASAQFPKKLLGNERQRALVKRVYPHVEPYAWSGGGSGWDPSNKTNTNITLSGAGNITATRSVAGGNVAVLGVAKRSTGKLYLEITGSGLGSNNDACGVVSNTFNVATPTFVQAAFNLAAFQAIVNNVVVGANVQYANNTVQIAVDIGAALIWFGTWISSVQRWNGATEGSGNNPALGTGGFDISSLTAHLPLFPAAYYPTNAGSDGTSTINTGTSAFQGPHATAAPPVGFSPWDPAAGQGVSLGNSLNVNLLLYDGVSSPLTITDAQPFDGSYTATTTVGSQTINSAVYRFTTHYRRGRVGQVKFSSPGSTGGQPWVLDGYDWDHTTGGLR